MNDENKRRIGLATGNSGSSASNVKVQTRAFLVESYKNNVLTWRMFMASSMKAAIHLGPDFFSKWEIYKNTRFHKIENVFNINQKRKTFSEAWIIIHTSRPRSTLFNDNVIKCAKAQVCVYTDSFLCVGRMEHEPGAA